MDGTIMINNDYSNLLSRYFNNRANNNQTGAADVYKRLKDRMNTINGKNAKETAEAEAENATK